MEERKPGFDEFILDIHPARHAFVRQMHDYLLQNGYQLKLEQAKSGYVASYSKPKEKRVVLNYVFRKSGLMARIYGDHVARYEEELLQNLPDSMNKTLEKAPVCKRLLNPGDCNSRCPMGYAFTLHGNLLQRCRYNCFLFLINEESEAPIRSIVEREVVARSA